MTGLRRGVTHVLQKMLGAPSESARGTQAPLEEFIHSDQIRTVLTPIVDLDTRGVMGWEAVASGRPGTRFHELLEMRALTPDQLVHLDRHCISAALSSAGQLAGEARLFLRILPSFLRDPFLHGSGLVEMLRQHNVAPTRIVLEISEQYQIANYPLFMETQAYFADLGLELAIDNLGKGYCGLERWAHLQPNYAKLSGILVRNIDTNSIKHELIRTFTKLFAERMGTALIAAGVESEGELKVLRELGVRYGQGGLLGRPLEVPVRQG